MFTRTVAYFALTGLLFGCGGESLTAADVAGTYALFEIEASSLPYLLRSGSDCDFTATSGTLNLGVDNRFEIVVNETVDCSRIGQEPGEVGHLYEGPYEIEGERLTLVALPPTSDRSVPERMAHRFSQSYRLHLVTVSC